MDFGKPPSTFSIFRTKHLASTNTDTIKMVARPATMPPGPNKRPHNTSHKNAIMVKAVDFKNTRNKPMYQKNQN